MNTSGPPFTRTEYDESLTKVISQLKKALHLLRSVHFRIEGEPELLKEIDGFLNNCDKSLI
jgi:hypothetical protein